MGTHHAEDTLKLLSATSRKFEDRYSPCRHWQGCDSKKRNSDVKLRSYSPQCALCISKSNLEPLARRKGHTLKPQIPLVLSALAPQTHSQKTAKQPLYQTPGCLSLKMRCIYNIQILGSSVSEVYALARTQSMQYWRRCTM